MRDENSGPLTAFGAAQIDVPFFLLSKKAYASGQTTLEFIVKENKKISAQVFLTLDTDQSDEFILGKEYYVSFARKDK